MIKVVLALRRVPTRTSKFVGIWQLTNLLRLGKTANTYQLHWASVQHAQSSHSSSVKSDLQSPYSSGFVVVIISTNQYTIIIRPNTPSSKLYNDVVYQPTATPCRCFKPSIWTDCDGTAAKPAECNGAHCERASETCERTKSCMWWRCAVVHLIWSLSMLRAILRCGTPRASQSFHQPRMKAFCIAPSVGVDFNPFSAGSTRPPCMRVSEQLLNQCPMNLNHFY